MVVKSFRVIYRLKNLFIHPRPLLPKCLLLGSPKLKGPYPPIGILPHFLHKDDYTLKIHNHKSILKILKA